MMAGRPKNSDLLDLVDTPLPPGFTGSVWGTERRFKKNIRRCLCARGLTLIGLARSMADVYAADPAYRRFLHGYDNARPEHLTRKIRRLLNGATLVRLEHVEMFAAVLGVPPAVLAYGSVTEVRRALGEWA